MTAVATEVQLRRFTRIEYEHLIEKGFFRPEERLELVDGYIRELSTQGTRHGVAVRLIWRALACIFDEAFDIMVQMPLALGPDSEPQPDLAVVPGDPRDYLLSHPTSATLVVEVADISLEYDRDCKAALYARTGIQEYWILVLDGQQLEVLRDPQDGAYQSRILLNTTDRISPLARPEASISVADLFP